ncbi:MAG TPA: glucosamine-6-phosphate deaminase [Candidatus Limnocylindrales bacterium]|nr:glucosamine-6-phosphate deaminase [Candidatus Limnocylindrales bacterium]
MADVRVLPAGDWAAGVTAELAQRVRAADRLRVCLPTGSTPAPLYAELVAAARRGEISFADVEIVLLDEYVGLAADDPARCDVQLRTDLVDRLPVSPLAFHPIAVDTLAPEDAAAVHDQVAAAGLDIAVVGLGRNGHVGFNEPGSTADSPTRVVELTAASIETSADYGAHGQPTHGITLGLDRLLQANEVWLLVTGEHKSDVLRASLEGAETPDVPASYLRRHPRLVVWANEEAAAGLAEERNAG